VHEKGMIQHTFDLKRFDKRVTYNKRIHESLQENQRLNPEGIKKFFGGSGGDFSKKPPD
jgi:hypothetical protein